MAITAELSQKELERVAGLAYEGRAIRVSLADDPGDSLTVESTVASWDALKISGNGYADFRAIVAAGSYDAGTLRYQMPDIDAEFTATGIGYTYDSIYVVLGNLNTVNISNTELTSNVATITTAAAHGFSPGEDVYVSGATDSDYDGWHVIASTPTTTTFTYNLVTGDKTSAASTGTSATVTEETYLHSLTTEDPAIDLAAAQVQTYRIILATDD